MFSIWAVSLPSTIRADVTWVGAEAVVKADTGMAPAALEARASRAAPAAKPNAYFMERFSIASLPSFVAPGIYQCLNRSERAVNRWRVSGEFNAKITTL
jgi:hypothetical protein